MPIATGIDVPQPELQNYTIHIFHFHKNENDYILFNVFLCGNILISTTCIKNKGINYLYIYSVQKTVLYLDISKYHTMSTLFA